MKALLLKLAVLAVVGAAAAHAAFTIPWHTLDGGGGRSTGSTRATTFTVTGTIGQPEPRAGSAGGGGFSLTGGYWAAVIPTTGGPLLVITQAGPNAILSWGSDAIGYQLQYSTDLSAWTDYGNTITGTSSAEWSFRNGPRYFFRLKKP